MQAHFLLFPAFLTLFVIISPLDSLKNYQIDLVKQKQCKRNIEKTLRKLFHIFTTMLDHFSTHIAQSSTFENSIVRYILLF